MVTLTYIFPDKALHTKDCTTREHWLKNILSLFCIGIIEESKRRTVLPKDLIQYFGLVPTSTVDVVVRGRIREVELSPLRIRIFYPISFAKPYLIRSNPKHIACIYQRKNRTLPQYTPYCACNRKRASGIDSCFHTSI